MNTQLNASQNLYKCLFSHKKTMGRIKTTLTKRTALKLFTDHKEEFTKDFEKNKAKVTEFADIPSKKIRNIVAGYIARLVKQEEES